MDQPQSFEEIRYDKPAERVARITLARAEKHNGQTMRMLYEINDALDLAMDDDEVHVVVVAADGKNFSSGHDLNDRAKIGALRPPILGFGGYAHPGPQGHMAREQDRAATHGKGAVAANRDILEAKKPASQTH